MTQTCVIYFPYKKSFYIGEHVTFTLDVYLKEHVTCCLAWPVQIEEPNIKTIITWPKTQLTITYLMAFLVGKSLTSAAKVLTVVKHPQYPSARPCSIAHALAEGGAGMLCNTWNAARSAVPSVLAARVPKGSAFDR